jgi:phosphate transport system substrate-binding protein
MMAVLRRRLCALAAAALAALAVWSLAAAGHVTAAETTALVVAGSDDSQEMLRTLATRFMRDNPDLAVQVPDGAWAADGIKAVLAGQAGLGLAARPLRDEEKAQGLAEIVFAKVPVVFAVNPSVTDVYSLTGQQLLDVFSGKITDWSALGGPAGPIRPVCREAPEASRLVANQAIPGFADLGCPQASAAAAAPEAVARVADTPGAIGYFPLPAMAATKLRSLSLAGVHPSPESVSRGTYPLFVPYALVYKPPLSPAALLFLKGLSLPDGRTALANYGCLPLPIKLAAP